ncbi:MAG TPA: hypothetical protein VNL77_05805, partial [Roseiflexaceae bacterium]|nr:hypothetical protein [Roseiflexaceae bacterium]
QPIGGSEYLDQSVSICIFGVAPGSVTPISPSLSASPVPVGLLPDSGASTSVGSAAGAPAPGELMLFSRALQADPTVRCRPAADDVLTDVIPGLGLGSGGYTYQGRPVLTLPLAVYPPRQGFNSEVPFLTADQGENEFLPGLFGVVTFQRNIYQARVEIFNSNTAPGVVFVAYALDESGQVANTSQLVLSVPGPYVLNVVSPRPETLRIRQVLIVAYESDLEGGREVVQLPIVLRRVEINFQPR